MRKFTAFVGLVLAIVFSFLATRGVDISRLKTILGTVNLVWLIVGLIGFAAGYLVRVFRWRLMLRDYDSGEASIGKYAVTYVASVAINNILPFHAGDLTRISFARTQLNIPVSATLASMWAEGALDAMVLAVFFCVGLLQWDSPFTEKIGYAIFIATVAMFAIFLIFVFSGRLILQWLNSRIAPRIARRGIWHLLFHFIRQAVEALGALGDLSLMIRLIVLTVLAWLLEGSLVWAVLQSMKFYGYGTLSWFAMSASGLASFLPGTPGNFGTFHYFLMLVATHAGLTNSEAAAYAILTHALIWLPITVVGLAFAFRYLGIDALNLAHMLGMKAPRN